MIQDNQQKFLSCRSKQILQLTAVEDEEFLEELRLWELFAVFLFYSVSYQWQGFRGLYSHLLDSHMLGFCR